MCYCLRRSIAYLLLLLLPLQALAAGMVVACPMEYEQSMDTVLLMENCGDPTMVHAGMPDDHAQRDAVKEMQQGAPPCGMSNTCFTLAAIGLPPATRTFNIESAFSPIGFAERFYRSHIPEGLQRPPQPVHS